MARYQKGQTAPDGSLVFTFPAVSMRVKSTALQWLVVSGRTATFAGSATVNDVPGHRFEAQATDGRPDRFRLRVWSPGGALVYDSIGLRPVQGQVQIHT